MKLSKNTIKIIEYLVKTKNELKKIYAQFHIKMELSFFKNMEGGMNIPALKRILRKLKKEYIEYNKKNDVFWYWGYEKLNGMMDEVYMFENNFVDWLEEKLNKGDKKCQKN